MSNTEIFPPVKLRSRSRPCPHCGIRENRPSRRRDPQTDRLSRWHIYPFVCVKCHLPFYSWAWKPVVQETRAKANTEHIETFEDTWQVEVQRKPDGQSNERPPTTLPPSGGNFLPLILGLCLLLLIGAQVASLLYIERLNGTLEERRNVYTSVVTTEEVSRALFNMEAANRGFLLTGDAEFRDKFNYHRDILSSRYQTLLASTSDDSIQQSRLKTFKTKLTAWFQLYNPVIERLRSQQSERPQSRGISRADKAKIVQCKVLFEEMLQNLDEIRTTQEAKSWLY